MLPQDAFNCEKSSATALPLDPAGATFVPQTPELAPSKFIFWIHLWCPPLSRSGSHFFALRQTLSFRLVAEFHSNLFNLSLLKGKHPKLYGI